MNQQTSSKQFIFTCMASFFLSASTMMAGAGFERLEIIPGETNLRFDVALGDKGMRVDRCRVEITDYQTLELLWEGIVRPSPGRGKNSLSFFVDKLDPELWYPCDPHLYSVALYFLSGRDTVFRKEIRTGFRSFTTQGGMLYLNRKPVFLRGIAINPPGRGIPDEVERDKEFALDYVRFMKSINVNMIRIPDDQNWYDACDELGMMVFGGNYSGSVAGSAGPPKDRDRAVEWYKHEKFGPISHHPSLMIYALTNEVPYTGTVASEWEEFLSYAYERLRDWDPNRLYIGNPGYGYGKSGDICDLHRYWGWYYASPYTFLNLRDNRTFIPFNKKVQPITFTECVGNYTGPDGRYNLTPNHKNPVSQLCWTGHAAQKEQAILASEHQCHTFKQATELIRRLRYINPELSGVMPFTIMFYNWHTVKSFPDMDPKPVCKQASVSYQPVLLSWELWTPQVYSGSSISPVAHIVNDADDYSDLGGASLIYGLVDKSQTVFFADTIQLPEIEYYGTAQVPLSIKIPDGLPNGKYELSGRVVKGDMTVSMNTYELFVAGRDFAVSASYPEQIHDLYDPSGKTAIAFKNLNIKFNHITSMNGYTPGSTLVIGENGIDNELLSHLDLLGNAMKKGCRLLVLKQKPERWSGLNQILPVPLKGIEMDIDDPVYPPPPRPSVNGFNINPERPDNPVFKGLKREHFRIWSDYTDWNESSGGMPSIYPVTGGFLLGDRSGIEKTAVLANYSVGLEGIALAEIFGDTASVILCGFDLANRQGIDPVADRLLINLAAYLGSQEDHFIHPLIEAPIIWGEYETEMGLLTGINSGLMLNTMPVLTGSYREKEIVIHRDGHQFAERPAGWNTRAGIQYIPYGRRPFGPYIHIGFGGVPEPENSDSGIGEGGFRCRIPPDKTSVVSKVWNPDDEPLEITIEVNTTRIFREIILPRTFKDVTAPINRNMGSVSVSYRGDRRLVILETAFR